MTENIKDLKESEDFLDWAKKEHEAPDYYWKKFLDAIEDPVFIMSANGRILLCNKALEKFLNMEAEDIISNNCFSLVHRTKTFINGCPFVKSRKSGKRETYMLNMSERWYKISIDPIYDKESRFAGAVHIISDVHDILKTNAERAMLGKVIENTGDGVISTDLKGRITGWNRGAERMLEYGKEEALERQFTELLADSSEFDIKAIVKQFNEKQHIERKDANLSNKNGGILDVSLGASPVYDERNVLSGAAFILTDHTEQRKAEQNLLSFMTEAVLRLEKPLEMIKTNIEDIRNLYENRDIDRDELSDLLSIQIKNAEKVLENVIKLKKATAKEDETIPDIMKDFFRQ